MYRFATIPIITLLFFSQGMCDSSKWCTTIVEGCISTIDFLTDSTFQDSSCESESTTYGKYLVSNDTLYLHSTSGDDHHFVETKTTYLKKSDSILFISNQFIKSNHIFWAKENLETDMIYKESTCSKLIKTPMYEKVKQHMDRMKN